MTIVANYAEPLISFLGARMVGVVVSGPQELPLADTVVRALPLTVIVEANPSSAALEPPVVTIGYTLRFIAATVDDAILLYGGAATSLSDPLTAQPISNIAVAGRWWLYDGRIGPPTGPTPDPEAGWPTVVATATMTWSMIEL